MTEEDKTREEVTGEEGGCEKRGGNVAYVVSYCWQSLLKNAQQENLLNVKKLDFGRREEKEAD